MTWSFQLTPWALPPILALLLVARDLGFLWPRRRESGTPTLLALAVTVALWASLDLLGAVSPSLGVKVVAARLEYLPGAMAPVVWSWFALAHAGRKDAFTRWPMGLLYAASLTLAGTALGQGTSRILIRSAHLEEVGETLGLQLVHGPGHWVFLTARLAAVLVATWVVSRSLARGRHAPAQAALAGIAGALALAPPLAHLAWAPGSEWADVSSLGFALGCAFLVWGLMRPHILNLGPVDGELVLRELRDPLVVIDARGRIVDANRAAKDELGLEPYGDVPVALGTLWAAGPAPAGTPPARIVLGHLEDEAASPRTFEVTLTPLGDSEGARSALLLRDVTLREAMRRELEKANADLERLARTDGLTGLANRRHFMEVLEQEVERAQRYQRPLSLVLLDLDHFKRVNDTHGHAAGDDVLKAASAVLKSVCRDVDLAARLGGEELALILPETDAAGAHTVAERVRRKIEAGAHRSPAGDPFSVTASMGVATIARDTGTGEALLQASDEALYRAKDGGRNRVVLAG